MSNFIKYRNKFITLGVFEDTSAYLAKKIKISNIIAIVLTLWLYVPFAIICILYFSNLTFLPAIAAVVTLGTIFLNYLRYYNLSRILVSLTGIIADVLFHSFSVSPGQNYIAVIFLIQFLFIIIPLVLFSLKEKALLIGTSLAVFVIFVSVLFLSNLIVVDIDATILKEGIFFNILVFALPFAIYGVLLPFLVSEQENEIKSLELLSSAKENEIEAQKAGKMLEEELDKMKILQEENAKRILMDKQRDWSVQGISKFNEILRTENSNIQELSFSIIRDLVKYLGVNQGGLFLLNDNENDEKLLEMQASVAYDRRKYLEKEILIGEGLVGSCFLEKKTIYLTRIPQDYIRITSGLGSEKPGSLLIVPMIMNNKVLGVIELASFKKVEKYKIEFVEKLGESVASSLSIARINEKTKKLVKELEMQAEQQAAQEEEMMQNVEEMRATQEESLRKEKGLLDDLEKAKAEVKSLKNI